MFLAGDDEGRQHRQHRPVHGHGDAHAVQRYAVEQDLHVLDAVDRHTRLADVADNARVIGIVPAMGGEIEGDREAHLPCRQILPEEGVRFFGRREAGVLADGPGAVGVHRCPWSPQIGRESRHAVEVFEVGQIGNAIERLDRDAFGRFPDKRIRPACRRGRVRQAPPNRPGTFSRTRSRSSRPLL